jgi:hypothetical protein
MKRSRPTGCRNASRKADTPLSPPPADLKRQLAEKVKAALSDDEMSTSNRDPITIPPIVIDSDPTDDMEITLPPIVIDSDPTDDMR